MLKFSTFVFVIVLIMSTGISLAEDSLTLKDEKDRISYSVGYQVGGDFKRQGLEINPEFLVKGIQDALLGTQPKITPEEMRTTLTNLKKQITAAQREKNKQLAAVNLAAGKTLLEANGKKEGVITLPSGLQYKVIQEGSGKMPTASDTVSVHYRGTLIDGTEFDSSYKRGKAATFRADRVIAGWKEALQLMKEGAKWQLFIPANLAYGQRGAGAKIPPNSTLIFEVELISIQPSK